MTRAVLTKLFILVMMAFIICLPEFFTLYRAPKVNFVCLPYRPCERGNRSAEKNERIRDSEIRQKDECDPSQTSEPEQWETCTQENQNRDLGSRSNDPEKNWLMCEADMDMAEMHRNLPSSELRFQVYVELQFSDTETLNLTMYSLSNSSSLYLHPPKEDDGAEEEGKMEGPEDQIEAGYCCPPALPISESATQRHCLLWFTNQTFLMAAAKQLPLTERDEWQCLFRVLWLVLLGVVLLIIVTAVFGQIRLHKKSKAHPLGTNVTGQQFKGIPLHFDRTQSWAGLSPIQEVESQDDIETLLDGNVDLSFTANLHHRSHHATYPPTGEQTL